MGTQPHPFIYVLSVTASVLQQQSWIVLQRINGLQNLEYLLYDLTEKNYQPFCRLFCSVTQLCLWSQGLRHANDIIVYYCIILYIIVYYFYNPTGQHSVYKEKQSGSSSPPFRFSLQGLCDDNSQGSTCKQKLGSQSMSRLKNEANLQRGKVRSCFPEETKCWK